MLSFHLLSEDTPCGLSIQHLSNLTPCITVLWHWECFFVPSRLCARRPLKSNRQSQLCNPSAVRQVLLVGYKNNIANIMTEGGVIVGTY
jgi:hypothetical protein